MFGDNSKALNEEFLNGKSFGLDDKEVDQLKALMDGARKGDLLSQFSLSAMAVMLEMKILREDNEKLRSENAKLRAIAKETP